MGQKNFSDITTFKVGGKIKHYFEVKSEKEIVTAVSFAKNNNLPIFIIGGGSDILVSDKDFNGVVIKYVGKKLKIKDLKFKIQVTAEAGLAWDKLVEFCVNKNLQGIECLSWIPGTVGAAPIQNIGAYGQELKDTFVELTAYDIKNEKFVKFTTDDCQFGYRESIFKTNEYWQKFLITSVTLKLNKYADSELDLTTIRNQIIYTRQEKLEDPDNFGNAGSFFKNPIVSENKKIELLDKYPEIRIYPFEDKFKVSAGWLLENSGYKGFVYGNAGVSLKHALILINKTGKATAKEVYDLSEIIIADVYKKFGIKLEREVQLINF